MSLTFLPEGIEAYAEAHSEPVHPIFEKLRDETYATMDWPTMQVGRLEGGFLRLLARLVAARRILEVGMFTGYSALMMAEALPDGGELITCDINPKAERLAKKYFAQHPAGSKIKIRMGDALTTLASLQGPFDMAFVDADKENYLRYYEAILPLLRRGGLLVADNTLWSGRVLSPKEPSDKGIVDFNTAVAKDTRVEKVLLTVRDGMMLVFKK